MTAPDMATLPSRSRNRLLGALTAEEHGRLAPYVESVQLRQGDILAAPAEPLAHIYFPETALISMIATSNHASVEVAFAGWESVAGSLALLATPATPYGLVVNLPGEAVRVPIDVAQRVAALSAMPGGMLMPLVHRAVRLLVIQTTQAAVCNRFHSPRQRLARWLALASEHMGTNLFPMTHEVMAGMVGGARSMVTQASNELRDMGAVDYRRGSLRVLDPERLRAETCDCYAVVLRALAEMTATTGKEN